MTRDHQHDRGTLLFGLVFSVYITLTSIDRLALKACPQEYRIDKVGSPGMLIELIGAKLLFFF